MPSCFSRSLISIVLLVVPICAQQFPPSWDFTYESVLDGNSVGETELIRKWIARDESPVKKWYADWPGRPIVSSILIEHPNFHAGEHTIYWLVRTADEAFYWEQVEGNEADRNEEPIAISTYDDIYKAVSSWRQRTPVPAKELNKDEWPGYFGFLSFHGPGRSQQMLLTTEDFISCLDKICVPGRLEVGRVLAALEPILLPDAGRRYKHRSEAEIARMTPAELVDHAIMEREHHTDPSDRHPELIRKYLFQDVSAALPHLVDLIDSYNPKRNRDDRSSWAAMLAFEIDDKVVRLRGSVAGQRVIDAVARVSVRMRQAGKKYSYDEMHLPRLKGVNAADQHILDTFWVKFRIRISEAELLAFSNYLVQSDPAYPSWSKTDFIKDHSRRNEAGNPAQVYVYRSPKRFRRAYSAFQKLRRQ